MANRGRTIYVGVTNDLAGRVQQHKTGVGSAFTARYGLTDLVYYESVNDVNAALSREKQIKGWTRGRKVALIEAMNPEWDDLAALWAGPPDPSLRSG